MSELKCPFCQQELVGEGSDNYWCKKCNLERHIPALYGSQELWQELIRTRKALDLALDALETIGGYLDYNDCVGVALNATDKIYEALEQKEHFADASKMIEQKDVK